MILFLFFSILFYFWLMRLVAAGKNLDDLDVTMVHVEVLHQRMTSAVMDSSTRCGITFNATRELWGHLFSVSRYRTVFFLCYYL
ncbi:hypothetical protein C8J56DRAFT_909245 [Mycena floridula]|nr:hypothetical protein C8J56DRAFT_909245 [Mycena floridula]